MNDRRRDQTTLTLDFDQPLTLQLDALSGNALIAIRAILELDEHAGELQEIITLITEYLRNERGVIA